MEKSDEPPDGAVKLMQIVGKLMEGMEPLLEKLMGEPIGVTMVVWPKAKGMEHACIAGTATPDELRPFLEGALKLLLESDVPEQAAARLEKQGKTEH